MKLLNSLSCGLRAFANGYTHVPTFDGVPYQDWATQTAILWDKRSHRKCIYCGSNVEGHSNCPQCGAPEN